MSEVQQKVNELPDIVKIKIEFEDGSCSLATGEDAMRWGEWLDEGVSWAVTRGRSPPDIEYDEQPDWKRSLPQDRSGGNDGDQ